MQNTKAAEILHRYKEGNATEEEKLLLKKWFLTYEEERGIEFTELHLKEAEAKMWNEIQSHLPAEANDTLTKGKYHWKGYAAAAAVFVLISIAVFLGLNHHKPAGEGYVTLHTTDLRPGSDKAILVYGNGQQRVLSGKVYRVGERLNNVTGAEGSPTPGGNMEPNTEEHNTAEYNTIITPKGGQYQVVLPDGTEVWLNAASSLKYPTTFVHQKQRKVKLTGEAYFEVAHQKTQPFKVETADQEVEVLGTHFNINSYTDEQVTATTLMSGSVKISAHNGFKIMRPGEQAVLSPTDLVPKISAVDAAQAIAWKNGFFQFKRADFKTVMRQISRWYDVEVNYQGAVPEKIFTGKIYRNLKLSEALEVLRYFDVHFSLDGRKLTINN